MKHIPARLISIVAAGVILALPASALAHVTVVPSEVVASTRQTFSVSVPNERDVPVVGVRLVLPEGLGSVRAHAKPGWSIDATTSGSGEDITTTDIVWTSDGGTVPVKLKDDFLFSARVTASEGSLQWKAYETYADGIVVAWDQSANDPHPASVTRVVTEISADTAIAEVQAATVDADTSADRALYIALAAAAISIVALALSTKSKH